MSVYTCSVSITGTNSAACGSYPNCEPTCCNNVYDSCSGTTTGCPGKTQAQCTAAGACCSWGGGPLATCRNVTCVGMSDANCGGCAGCTKTGSCSNKSCGSQTNPTTCEGCSKCLGDLTLDAITVTLPWIITVKRVRQTTTGLIKQTATNYIKYQL